MSSPALKRPASISLADKVPLRSKIRVGPSCTRISELCRLHFCGSNLWSVPQPDLVIPRTFGFSRRISPCRYAIHPLARFSHESCESKPAEETARRSYRYLRRGLPVGFSTRPTSEDHWKPQMA